MTNPTIETEPTNAKPINTQPIRSKTSTTNLIPENLPSSNFVAVIVMTCCSIMTFA